MTKTSLSIVTYNHTVEELALLLGEIDKSMVSKIYIVDNSASKKIESVENLSSKIEYIYLGKNIGYGAGHNIAIKKSISSGNKYHIVANPDISLSASDISNIEIYMEMNENVGLTMPKILYDDGSLQRLVKLLPNPLNLIGRRFFSSHDWAERMDARYELKDFDYSYAINSASLSGCFMFLRNETLQKVGYFDERFFMYLEDYDLVRRIHRVARTMYIPMVAIYHGFKKESFKSKVLRNHHIKSAIKYFFKWGWFYDRERTLFNKETLKQISK